MIKYKEIYRDYLLSRIELLKSIAPANDLDIATLDIMISVFLGDDYFGTDVDSIYNDINNQCDKHGVHRVIPYSEYIILCRDGELDKLGI